MSKLENDIQRACTLWQRGCYTNKAQFARENNVNYQRFCKRLAGRPPKTELCSLNTLLTEPEEQAIL